MSKRTRLLLKANNEQSKQLNRNDEAVLTDIVVYLRGSKISEYQQEVVRRDILQMILDAESRGDSIETVIGGDSQAFCDAVLQEIPPRRPKDRILSALGTLCLAFTVLCAVWLVFSLLDLARGAGGWPYLPVTASAVASGVLLLVAALSIFHLITKHAFHQEVFQGRNVFFLLFSILMLSFSTRVLGGMVILSLHVVSILLSMVVFFVVYKVIDITCD